MDIKQTKHEFFPIWSVMSNFLDCLFQSLTEEMIPLDQQTSSIRDSSSWRINAKNEFIVHKKYQETSKWMAQEQFYCMPTREMPGSNQPQSDVVWCATYPHSTQKDLGQAAAGPEELIKMPQRQPQIDAFLFRTCLTAQFCRWAPLQSTVSLDQIQNSVAEVQHFWQCFWVKSVSPTFFWWLNSCRRNSRKSLSPNFCSWNSVDFLVNSAEITKSPSLGLQAVGEARAAVDVALLEGTWVGPGPPGLWGLNIWVCLKIGKTPKPTGFADHYPY